MTKKLYYEDLYRTEATATVVKIDGNRLFLDQTIFYPEAGGQVGDTGFIDNYRVIDTQKAISAETKTLFHSDFPVININTDVAHIMEDTNVPLSPSHVVCLKLDWDRRYRIMRMHSASHLAYHFTLQVFGHMNVQGCYIYTDSGRFDFVTSTGMRLDPERLTEVEQLCNSYVDKAFVIENVPLPNEPEALYWLCNDIKMPCGGTHVRNTLEIGRITLKRKKQGKSLDRLYIMLSDQ